MQPDVTVVIPVFNKEKYLRRCLQSVAGQSLKTIEIVCIDDGSTDGSRRILEKAMLREPRLRVIDNGKNLGAGTSRNKGIEAARGRFVRFVDADDLLPERSTQILYDRAIRTGSDVVRGSIALFRRFRPKQVFEVPDRIATSLREEPVLWIPWWHTTYLISVDFIRANDLSYPPQHHMEDPVFIARLLTSARQISLIPDVVYLYRKYHKLTGSGALGFEVVRDKLEHAAVMKALFLAYHPDCWDRGYGPFLRRDVRYAIENSGLGVAQREFANSAACNVWGDIQHPDDYPLRPVSS